MTPILNPPKWRGRRRTATSSSIGDYCPVAIRHTPATGHGTNEIERFFVGSDRRLGVDAGGRRKRSLAASHERPVAADKRLVRTAVRTRGVPASGGSVEESCGHQRFRLASIRCRTTLLCRRAYCFDNLASPILSVWSGPYYGSDFDLRECAISL
jgi:hypothetical protein